MLRCYRVATRTTYVNTHSKGELVTRIIIIISGSYILKFAIVTFPPLKLVIRTYVGCK